MEVCTSSETTHTDSLPMEAHVCARQRKGKRNTQREQGNRSETHTHTNSFIHFLPIMQYLSRGGVKGRTRPSPTPPSPPSYQDYEGSVPTLVQLFVRATAYRHTMHASSSSSLRACQQEARMRGWEGVTQRGRLAQSRRYRETETDRCNWKALSLMVASRASNRALSTSSF